MIGRNFECDCKIREYWRERKSAMTDASDLFSPFIRLDVIAHLCIHAAKRTALFEKSLIVGWKKTNR